MVTRRKLEEKAAHLFPERGRDLIIRFHEMFGAHHPFLMRDALVDFHAIDKGGRGISFPPSYRRRGRPAIEWRVQLDGAKNIGVISKPVLGGWLLSRIEDAPPVRVKPSGTTDVYAHLL